MHRSAMWGFTHLSFGCAFVALVQAILPNGADNVFWAFWVVSVFLGVCALWLRHVAGRHRNEANKVLRGRA